MSVFYRCKEDPHHRMALSSGLPHLRLLLPIVDSVEGVTHALRTIKYKDRDAMYTWVQKMLNLRPCTVYEYSNSTWFARSYRSASSNALNGLSFAVCRGEPGEGLEQPALPHCLEIIRRGMQANALKDFMLNQGPSKNNSADHQFSGLRQDHEIKSES